MEVLLVAMEHDYGDPARGRSYEYYNFYDSLKIEHNVVFFDYMSLLKVHGKKKMNEFLVQQALDGNFEVVIFSLYTDQIEFTSVEKIRKNTLTLCFFHDDTWRRDFVLQWAPHFDFFTSTDFNCYDRYKSIGLENVIHFPFGANQRLYRPENSPKLYEVSFVGGWSPTREWLITRLRKAGVDVKVAGHGWPGGIVDHDEMVRIFNASKINLNLSNSMCWDLRLFLSAPVWALRQLRSGKNVEQLKARHFEINSCGGFQLSYYVDGLEKAYDLGGEIAVYLDPDDLIEKAQYYLMRDELREKIAAAGLSRTLEDHTFSSRFEKIFSKMGLNSE